MKLSKPSKHYSLEELKIKSNLALLLTIRKEKNLDNIWRFIDIFNKKLDEITKHITNKRIKEWVKEYKTSPPKNKI